MAHLTRAGRQRAYLESLPLLLTYFASSDRPLTPIEVDAELADEADEELRSIQIEARFRVVLADARAVHRLAERLIQRLSVRQDRVRREDVGEISGRLDVERYITMRTRKTSPRRFPIVVLERNALTPENVLLCYACRRVMAELSSVRIPSGARRSADEAEARRRVAGLSRTIGRPDLTPPATEAESVWNRRSALALVARVERRIRRGQARPREPYRQLCALVRKLEHPSVDREKETEILWYGEEHDPKLYEIWVLERLARGCTAICGEPIARSPLWQRDVAPIFTWALPAPVSAPMHMYFQRRARVLVNEQRRWRARWHREHPSDAPLEGVPDVVLQTEIHQPKTALVDAKLRETDSATDEVYKLLGYFSNYSDAAGPQPWGALVYGSDGGYGTRYVADAGGTVVIISAWPDNETEAAKRFEELAADLLTGLGSNPQVVEAAAEVTRSRSKVATAPLGEDEDEPIAATQTAVVTYLERLKAAERVTLEAPLAELKRLLPTAWPELSAATQTMLATAEHFGQAPPLGVDFSPMVLELSAALELECAQRVFEPYCQTNPGDPFVESPKAGLTLGVMARCLRLAVGGDPEARQFLRWLHGKHGAAELLRASKDIGHYNFKYRRPAAHTTMLDEKAFDGARASLYGLEGRRCLLAAVLLR